ncbi:MAG: GDSL-type esterase/lipase family protein [Candidatus Azobacteroides sp.]|nr:GDSL-type esterase/lipase family protein [Candidatus Azobacteroides sp.]
MQRTDPYEYKFVNGQSWEGAEVVFGDCAYRSNRMLVVEEDNMVLDPVALGMCGTTPGNQTKIACIGDSNTEATGVSNPWINSWPSQLKTYLDDDYTTENFGVSGATLMQFPDPWGAWTNNVSNMYEYNQMYNPDIILVALGSNDSKNGYWGQRDFKADYISLINEFKQFSSDPQIYMIIPIRAFDNGYDINNNNIVNGIIPAINELSKTQMLPVIDWYTLTASLTKDEYMPDGVHANEVASRMMAEKAAQVLMAQKPVIKAATGAGTFAANTYSEYRWYRDGALIEGASGETYTATQTGTYNVAVKLSAETDDVIVSEPFVVTTPNTQLTLGDTTTGINNEDQDVIELNYVAGNLIIKNAAGGIISLYDATGAIVKVFPLHTQEEIIDITDLSGGVYICNVLKEQAGKVKKIIK